MTRINVLRNPAFWGSVGALLFAAVLIVCSTVDRSGEKPQPVSSNNQIPVMQTPSPIASVPAPAVQPEKKPAPKKVVHKKPATVNYSDKAYGVTFEYPRRYAIDTGKAAADVLGAGPIPMNFVEPGGEALATVELPETGYANTDFSSAFFNVSVHKALTADQCNEFAVPQPKIAAAPTAPAAAPTEASAPVAAAPAAPAEAQPASATTAGSTEQASVAKVSNEAAAAASSEPSSKLLLGDLELKATEAVSGEGTRQSDSKYFHVYQNGTCYEFVLNVTTVASEDGTIRHVDRDKVFDKLEKILATVKINPVTPEATAEAPATPAAAAAPAQ